jgi:ParB family chromosome partitioning protein
MAKSRRPGGLGRGLNSILSDPSLKDVKAEELQKKVAVSEIAVKSIEANPFQPRSNFDEEALQELADSIKIHGIIQPITVRRLQEGKYQLISGERRLRASKLAKLKNIPAYVREADDQQMVMLALIENVWREDLNPIEIALSYQRMKEELKLTQKELEEKVEKKRATISNYLRLLKLPVEIQEYLRKGDKAFSMGHARSLAGIKDPVMQQELFKKIIASKLSVRQTEELAQQLKEGNKKAAKKKESFEEKLKKGTNQAQLREVEKQLMRKLNSQVSIKQDEASGRGEIRVKFSDTDSLNEILETLGLI